MPILLADNFKLPDRAITESIAAVGRKGSGKTYTGGRLFEQMYAAGAQCVALDPVGNWWGLRLSASGKRKGLPIPVFGGDYGDIPITPESGALMARTIVERNLSCVVDLMHFSKGKRKTFVTAFAEELFELKKRKRTPMHLFLEEARKFIPQKPISPDENRMIGAFDDIVRVGRNYGLGVTLLDQRPASVNKEVLSQTEILILHQITSAHDRKAIKEWLDDKSTDGADAMAHLKDLQPGECFFWSPGLMRKFAQIKVGKKHTFDASATPELDDVDHEAIAPRPLSGEELESLQTDMTELVEMAEAADPKKLQQKIRAAEARAAKLEKQLKAALERPPVESKVEIVPIDDIRGCVESVDRLVAPLGEALKEMSTAIIKMSTLGRALLREQPREPRKNGVARVPRQAPRVDHGISGPEQRVLDAVAWFEAIGVTEPESAPVAFVAGYRPTSGGYANLKGKLRTKGLIRYPRRWPESLRRSESSRSNTSASESG